MVDPRWFTTPAGAVLGLALTKAIYRDPTRAKYVVGGTLGGVAGFAGGSALAYHDKDTSKAMKDEKVRAAQESAAATGDPGALPVAKNNSPDYAGYLKSGLPSGISSPYNGETTPLEMSLIKDWFKKGKLTTNQGDVGLPTEVTLNRNVASTEMPQGSVVPLTIALRQARLADYAKNPELLKAMTPAQLSALSNAQQSSVIDNLGAGAPADKLRRLLRLGMTPRIMESNAALAAADALSRILRDNSKK